MEEEEGYIAGGDTVYCLRRSRDISPEEEEEDILQEEEDILQEE